jgi:hypothetical protein
MNELKQAAEYIRKYMSDHPNIKDLAPMYETYPTGHRRYLSQALIGIEPWKHMSNIPTSSFSDCKNITRLYLPSGVTNIGDYAFYGCTGLTSITIPDSATSIGYHAFFGCTEISSVTIGSGVTSIMYRAFYNCKSLIHIKFNGTVGQWERVSLDKNVFIDVPAIKITCSDGEAELRH